MAGFLQDELWIKRVQSKYTPIQVAQYLAAIGVSPPSTREQPLDSTNGSRRLETLEMVVKHHLLAFPFENTDMHYTASHDIDIDPQTLFKRFIVERKGSFCFGQNTVLLEMLRGLGYRSYAGAARVNSNWQDPSQEHSYGAQLHMVVFVQPFEDSSETYVVDVGFGGSGLVRPIPLVSGDSSEVVGVGPAEFHRLVKEPFPQSSLAQGVWHLEVRHVSESETDASATNSAWKRMFSFCEQEFFYEDCVAASATVTRSHPLFTQNVLCIRYVLDNQSLDSDLYRVIMHGNEVKARRNGETQVLATLKTELDRVKALREIFGIQVDDSCVKFVAGGLAQLR
ncbi:hypothetical protein H1R20_g4670, partial [Candolleomyces eurysporus]